MLSPDGPLRQRNHFKSFCRHISLYESLRVSMREQQRRNWRHGSAAESGVGSACRPPQRSGRTVRKSAVSVKVSADGPGLLTLAVPGNQKTARGGLGGDFYAPPAHGLARCRADGNPRGSLCEYMVHLRQKLRNHFLVPSVRHAIASSATAERWPRQALPALLMTEAAVWAACTVSALARVKCAS